MANAKTQLVLPIDDHLPRIADALSQACGVIVRASPGAGKTTRLPPFLLSRFPGKVLVLEPRRVAAKLSALRVAEEQGWGVGKEVGYRFRQESQVAENTRLVFLTEGLLVRQLQRDPSLQGVSVVILDEFHERHLHSDVALSVLRRLQMTTRPDLKIVVMSATIELQKLAEFLGGVDQFDIEGQRFPVQETFLKSPMHQTLDREVLRAVEGISAADGDVLVFLPGRREILACQQLLESRNFPGTQVFSLYGDLSIEEQQRVLIPIPGVRRIILSTNLAETSLTIEGIRVVIDSGLHRRASFSPWSGVPKLELRPISRSSAIQRAGRAGRLGPGRCLRLYTQSDLQSRLEFESPEILRSDLMATALELFSLGWSSAASWSWLESPRESNWQSALQSLERLALIQDDQLTDLGRQVVRFPISPRFGLALCLANAAGMGKKTAPLILGLAEGEIEQLDPDHPFEFRTGPKTQRALRQLTGLLEGEKSPTVGDLEKILFLSFVDRVCRARKKSTDKEDFTLAFGGSVEIPTSHPVLRKNPTYLVLVEAFQTGDKDRVKLTAGFPVSKHLVENHAFTEAREELYFDSDRRKVVKRSGMYFGDLVLMQSEEAVLESDREQCGILLVRDGLGIRQKPSVPDGLFLEQLKSKFDTNPLKESLARIRCLQANGELPELQLGEDWLEAGLAGCQSLEEVESNNWIEKWLQYHVPQNVYEVRKKIERLAPSHLKLGNRNAKIHYELEQPPWVESRIQDFFGLRQGPAIMGGRLPLTLHLLAPNQRAVQVTQDLPGFWTRHYPSLRKELSRDYPRHKWPEDPTSSDWT